MISQSESTEQIAEDVNLSDAKIAIMCVLRINYIFDKKQED